MQQLPSVLDSLPNVPQTLSENEKTVAARLQLSESLSTAADLLAQFPHCKAEDGFTRSMAELFNQYPASIVREITHMRNGLAVGAEFLSLAAMAKWLDQHTEPLLKAADWDHGARRQIENRGKPLESQPLLRKMQDWTAKRENEMAVETEKQRAIQNKRTKALMAETNEQRAAEYHARGLDPVYAGDNETVVSLQMMLHMGWRIETIDGRSALTRGGVA
mgnify:CR=1 FL=1